MAQGPGDLSVSHVERVKRCWDCSFYFDDDHYGADECGITNLQLDVDGGGPPPAWCPLRRGVALVQLEEQEDLCSDCRARSKSGVHPVACEAHRESGPRL